MPSLPAATCSCSLERGGGKTAEHSPQQVSRAREQVIHVEQVASGVNEYGWQGRGKQELWSGHTHDSSLVEGVEKRQKESDLCGAVCVCVCIIDSGRKKYKG